MMGLCDPGVSEQGVSGLIPLKAQQSCNADAQRVTTRRILFSDGLLIPQFLF